MITLLHCSRKRADRRASGTAQGPGSVLPCAPVRDRELAAKAPVEGAAAIPEASPFGGAEAREGRLPFMMPPSTWDSISGGITAVFTSHLHGDHFGGPPFLILDGQFSRSTRPLAGAGPPGTARRLTEVMERSFPGSSAASRRSCLEVTALRPGTLYRFRTGRRCRDLRFSRMGWRRRIAVRVLSPALPGHDPGFRPAGAAGPQPGVQGCRDHGAPGCGRGVPPPGRRPRPDRAGRAILAALTRPRPAVRRPAGWSRRVRCWPGPRLITRSWTSRSRTGRGPARTSTPRCRGRRGRTQPGDTAGCPANCAGSDTASATRLCGGSCPPGGAGRPGTMWTPPGGCSSTANGTCGQSSPDTPAITTGTAPTSPASNGRPTTTTEPTVRWTGRFSGGRCWAA